MGWMLKLVVTLHLLIIARSFILLSRKEIRKSNVLKKPLIIHPFSHTRTAIILSDEGFESLYFSGIAESDFLSFWSSFCWPILFLLFLSHWSCEVILWLEHLFIFGTVIKWCFLARPFALEQTLRIETGLLNYQTISQCGERVIS